MSTTWISMVVINSADEGTWLAFSCARKAGMSCFFAATDSTSAAISVQAR